MSQSKTPIADLVAKLLAAGLPNDAVIAAAQAAEEAVCRVDVTAEKRREWDRNYRRQKRAEQAKMSGGCRVDRVDVGLTPPPNGSLSPALTSYLLTPSPSLTPSLSLRGKVLPDDWEPKNKHYDLAKQLGIKPADVLEMATSMRDWSLGNANRAVARKADWDRTFSNWMRNQVKKQTIFTAKPLTQAQQNQLEWKALRDSINPHREDQPEDCPALPAPTHGAVSADGNSTQQGNAGRYRDTLL